MDQILGFLMFLLECAVVFSTAWLVIGFLAIKLFGGKCCSVNSESKK